MKDLNIDIPPIPDALKKSLELSQRLSEAVQPALEQQQRIQELTEIATRALPNFEITNPAIDVMKQMQFVSPLADQFVCYQMNPGITAALDAMSHSAFEAISASVQSATAGLSEALINAVQSPFIEWINTFEYSPLQRMLESLQVSLEPFEKYNELNKAYLQAMYDCDWFPYAGWIADMSLFQEVNQILATSKGKSKRRMARIDKAILSYYTSKEVKGIKLSWRKFCLEPHIKKMLSHAINAHLR